MASTDRQTALARLNSWYHILSNSMTETGNFETWKINHCSKHAIVYVNDLLDDQPFVQEMYGF